MVKQLTRLGVSLSIYRWCLCASVWLISGSSSSLFKATAPWRSRLGGRSSTRWRWSIVSSVGRGDVTLIDHRGSACAHRPPTGRVGPPRQRARLRRQSTTTTTKDRGATCTGRRRTAAIWTGVVAAPPPHPTPTVLTSSSARSSFLPSFLPSATTETARGQRQRGRNKREASSASSLRCVAWSLRRVRME